MVHRHKIAGVVAVTLALGASLSSTASASVPLAQGETATHIGATGPDPPYGIMSAHPTSVRVASGGPSGTKPCAPTCTEAVARAAAAELGFKGGADGQTLAAELGFKHGPDGQALAAQLGFKHGPDGQAPAAELGFNRGPAGQAPAAELGFNPRPVGQAPRSAVLLAGSQANPTGSTAGPSTGFDWGDAGIGAAGALGLVMLLAGGALVMTKGRQRPTSHAAQPTA